MSKKRVLLKLIYYLRTFYDHLCSRWYRLFIGHIGKTTVIRRHCRLDGDCLDHVYIGENCAFDSYFCLGARSVAKNGESLLIPEIRIGNNCNIGQFNHFTAVNKIVIGDNLLTGKFVLITDNSHGSSDYDQLHMHPSLRPVMTKGEVVIGNNVWLGDKVSVLSGVHIGNGCVVGANSVVTHDIPDYCIAVGIPAKVIKSLKQ